MTSLQKQDLLIGVTLILGGVLTLFVLIPNGVVTPEDLDMMALSPQFWPMIVTGIIVFCGLVICVQNLMDIKNGNTSDQVTNTGLLESVDSVEMFRAAVSVVLMLIYYWSIDHIGVIASSIVAIIIFTLFGGEKRPVYIASIAILLPVLLYYFFTFVANVPMPLGYFEQWR